MTCTLSLSPTAGWALLLLAPLVAWLIGGIPWGVLLVRWIRGVDLRTVGSGNIGATNAARAMGGGRRGLTLFLGVYLLDLAKAPAAMVPPGWLGLPADMAWMGWTLPVATGAAVILGHCFSPFLRFRGGKGVATTCGVLLMLDWRLLPLGLGVFFVTFLTLRMVSLGSILMGVSLPLLWILLAPEPWRGGGLAVLLFLAGLTLLILVRHRANLTRILAGTEPKVGLWKRRSEEP